MKKYLSKIVAVLMAAVMLIAVPFNAFAAGTKTYISDIMVASASTLSAAKQKLKNQGYTPLSSDVNEGNNKVICIGYKTTTNPDEAITDLAIMNMKGGYSFQEYTHVLEEYQEAADKLVGELATAVAEYRANYAAGKTNALIAHELLNIYYDNDFDAPNNKLGDIFASEETTKEQLSVIFMQASTLAVTSIETLLGLACADDWVSRLLATEEGAVLYTVEDDDNARTIYKSMAAFQEAIQEYEEIYNASGLTQESTEEEWTEYFDSLDEEDQAVVANYSNTRDYLKATAYKDGTLYDFFMQDLKELDNADLYPLARAMTPGQIATVPYASLANAIQYAVTGEDTMKSWLENLKARADTTTVDVFDGIDRSIFSADGIALTNEAMRQATSTSDYSWYKGSISESAETIYRSIIGTTAGVGAVGIAVALIASHKINAIVSASYQAGFANVSFVNSGIIAKNYTASTVFYNDSWDSQILDKVAMEEARTNAISAGAGSAWNIVAAAAKIVSAIAIAIFFITLVIYLFDKYDSHNKSIEYSDIPRIIVDQKTAEDGTHNYIYYYAAKDTDGEYADLNGWRGQEWNALYYTKDASAGDPILADGIVRKGSLKVDASYNLAVHGFGSTAAYNLNKYAKDNSGIYAFFKTESRASLTGTAVSYGSYGIVGVGGVILGAAIMFFLDKSIAKKPRKTKSGAKA